MTRRFVTALTAPQCAMFPLPPPQAGKTKTLASAGDEAEWHRVSFFGRLAEVAGQYLKKGSAVYVEGRIKTRKWQDKETGQDRFSTDIIADQMQMLGGRDDSGAQNTSYAPQERPARTQTPQRQPQTQSAGSRAIMDMEDDIPLPARAASCFTLFKD